MLRKFRILKRIKEIEKMHDNLYEQLIQLEHGLYNIEQRKWDIENTKKRVEWIEKNIVRVGNDIR